VKVGESSGRSAERSYSLGIGLELPTLAQTQAGTRSYSSWQRFSTKAKEKASKALLATKEMEASPEKSGAPKTY
jgi:hypothetical protein